MAKQPVLMIHDGGVDDYLSTILFATFDEVRALGVVVTPADCYIEPAVSATRKILDFMGRCDIPVAESQVRGLHAFPSIWRIDSYRIDHFPLLNERDEICTPLLSEDGEHCIVNTLRAADEPVRLICTGPLTPLSTALALAPDIEIKIKELVWMGGALNVHGNLADWRESGVDGTMESNVYWDPIAAAQVWASKIPIVLCPLDITNTVPCTSEFVRTLANQRRYPVSDLAGLCYSLVMHQPYFFWDVLATSYIGRPDLFELHEWETEIITREPSQGRTLVKPGGRKIRALHRVDTQVFYSYLLTQWAR
jgi:purine nucleosidase